MHDLYPGDLLDHLRSFEILATATIQRANSPYERAARTLGVDPSVLRRRIATLEAWIGAPLVAGRGAALVVTSQGDVLRDAAASLVDQVATLSERVRGARARVTIGCTEAITSSLMPSVLAALERVPGAPITTIRRAGTDACCRMIAVRELDLGIVRGDHPPSDLEAERLCGDRLWVAMPKRHALARRKVMSARELAAHPLVLYGERSQTQLRVMALLGPLGGRVRIEVDGRATALEYVRRGLGLAFFSLLPGDDVATRGVTARDVSTLFGSSAFWIVWKRGARTPAIDSVVAALRAAVA